MTTKKLSRILTVAAVAFAFAVLLAVSSMADFTVNVNGTVAGLENGVNYTAAQYDFASNKYGEFKAITDKTVLTGGVWGIKAGDAEPVAVFVQTNESGRISYWSVADSKPLGNISASVTDTYLPGKWTRSSDGAFSLITTYKGSSDASVCIWLDKKYFLTKNQEAKTVKVEETPYPVYTIEGTEYYLKDGAYYTTANNTLYEGEAEAVAVMVDTWKGAKPFTGENNKLAESKYYYGFTNAQIFPASIYEGYTSYTFQPTTGGLVINEGYSAANYKPVVTFFTKKIGSDVVNEYPVQATFSTSDINITVPKPEGIPADEYIVAMSFAPYAGIPDDFFSNSATNNEDRGYYHHYQMLSDANGVTVSPLPAPTGVVSGFGTLGGLDTSKRYEIAPATISKNGKGLTLGSWTEFDPDDRTLVGLYAIKEAYADRATAVSYVYAYSHSYADRAEIGTLGGSNGKTVLVTGGSEFVPGQYSGSYTTYFTNTVWQIMSHGQVDANIMKPSFDAQNAVTAAQTEVNQKQAAYDSAEEGDPKTAALAELEAAQATLATAKATLDTKNEAVVNALKKIVLRYTYAPEEIVPVGDVNSFKITANQNNGGFTMSGNQNKRVVAYVADKTGAVKTYETVISQAFSTYLDFTIDFTTFLPDEGYLVAFEVYLCDNISTENFIKATNQYAFRYYTMVDPANYSIDKPADLPVVEGKPEGITVDIMSGTVSGLDAEKRYQYAYFDINGNEQDDWTIVPVGATDIELGDAEGLVAIAFAGDGYTTFGSQPTYVYLPGAGYDNILHLIDIVGTGGTYNGKTISVPVVLKSSVSDGTVEFTEGTWMGIMVTNELAKHYSLDPLTLGTTGTPVAASLARNLKAAQEKYDKLAPSDAVLSAAETAAAKAATAVTNAETAKANAETAKTNAEATVAEKQAAYDSAEEGDAKTAALAELEAAQATLSNAETALATAETDLANAQTTKTNADTYLAELKANKLSPNADAIAAAEADLEDARTKAAARNAQIYYSYAYEADEIIPMDEFVSYKFITKVRQTGFKANGQVYTKFVFKVVDENNQLVDRVVFKPVAFNSSNTVTITKEDFEDTTGYIVGMVIYPFADIDGYYSYAGDVNGDYMVILLDDAYKVKRDLEPIQMTKLTETDGVVTGFSPAYSYQYAPYTMNGAIGDWTDIEGDSFTLTNAGLTAIRIKTNSRTYDSSEPQIFYLAGKASARQAISELDANDALIYQKSTDFIVGTYTGTRITYMNEPLVAKAGAHIHLDQQVGGVNSPDEAELLWLHANTEEEARAALKAEEDKKDSYYKEGHATGNPGIYFPDRLLGKINSFYGVEDRDYEGELAELQATIANAYKDSYVRYAYTADEIIPVDELKSITFYNKQRQGAIRFYAKSAANFYVMDENGEVTPYQWKSGYFHSIQYSEHIQPVNVQEEVDLPDSGWIVAIEYIPFAEVAADTVTAVCYTKLAYNSQAYAFEQNHVNMGFYYNNYEIEYPTIAKPDIEFADSKFTGLNVDKTYAYGRFTADGIELTEVTDVTEVAVEGFGIWGIKELSTDVDYLDSPYVLGYNKDLTTARNNIIHLRETTKADGTTIINVPIVADAGKYSATAAPVYNEGTWTGFSLTNSLAINHGYAAMTLGTTSCTVPYSDYAAKIKTAASDAELEAAREVAADALAKVYYSYEYCPEEVIPMDEFIKWSFTSAERQGSLTVEKGSLQTKFVFKVATENGIVDRAVYKDAVFNGSGTNITISIDDFEETDGYIVGIIIYPYGNCPEGTLLGCDKETTTEDILVVLGNDYTVYPTVVEIPTITLSEIGAVITVTNYSEDLNYAYSTDGGKTWVPFEGNKFTATKANAEYVVKSIDDSGYVNSKPSEAVTSPAVVVVGTSLVLDGQIGTKVYFDIDTGLVDIDTVKFYLTPKGGSEQGQGHVSTTQALSYATKLKEDANNPGIYSTVVYVPAKDADNFYYQNELVYNLKDEDDTLSYGNIGSNLMVTSYIKIAQELAAAGVQEFVDAKDVVNALEKYVAYADNYFAEDGALAEYDSALLDDAVITDYVAEGTPTGLTYYGTSLILEENVTIRHYFEKADGSFVHYDITDIAAQDIGTAQTFKEVDGFTLTYSVTNYIASMQNDSNKKLVSLVNAMYDYYEAAKAYFTK